MTTLESLRKEVEPYKNTLVLDFFQVKRLVDVIDGGDDFYWVYDTGRGIEHSTCVGSWIPLKGKIDEKEYNKLVTVWNLNSIEKTAI